MNDKLKLWKNEIVHRYLLQIEDLFAPEQPKITLIVRMPWLEDGGILITSDSIADATAELNRLSQKEPIR
jgi:hypothetical protein